MDILNPTDKTVDALMKLELPAGVTGEAAADMLATLGGALAAGSALPSDLGSGVTAAARDAPTAASIQAGVGRSLKRRFSSHAEGTNGPVAVPSAHRDARTGCLLVSVSDPGRCWQHPETGERIDRFGLQTLLQAKADASDHDDFIPWKRGISL